MQRAIRQLAVLLLLLVLGAAGSCRVAAAGEQGDTAPDTQDILQQQYDDTGVGELFDQLPDQTRDILDEQGLDDPADSGSFLDFLQPGKVLDTIYTQLKEAVTQPLALLAIVIITILVCAVAESMKTTLFSANYSSVISAVAALCVATSAIAPVFSLIKDLQQALSSCNQFIASFVPVYGTVIAASGQPITGSAYSGLLMLVVQGVSAICTNTIVPLLGLFLAFSVTGSLYDGLHIASLTRGIKNTIIFLLSALLTIFCGILSMQTFVGGASDSLALKTGKLLVGNLVPIVGSAVSDAMTSVYSCLHLLKNGVGVFGILAVLITFLPLLCRCLLYKLALWIGGFFCDTLGVNSMKESLQGIGNCLSVVTALCVTYSLLIVITTTIMMTAVSG